MHDKKLLFPLLSVLLITRYCFAGQLDTYTLTGDVIDYKGNFLENAVVVCYKDYSDRDEQGHVKFTKQQTSSDGKFSFEIDKEDISPLIVAYKPGLALGWASVHFENDYYPTIILGEPTFLKGIIVDEEGHPIADVDVRMILENKLFANANIRYDYLDPENWYSKKTDKHGQFIFENVPIGSYAKLEIRASGKATICVYRDNLSFTEYFLAGRDDILIVLPTEAVIKGQVIDETTGQGLVGIKVQAMPAKYINLLLSEEQKITDSNGWFEFTNLKQDKYVLHIVDTDECYGNVVVDVESSQTIEDIKIIYKKKIPFEVAVYKSIDEKPIANAQIMVALDEPESDNRIFSREMTTDANGIVRLNIAPLEHNLEVTKLDYGTTIFDQYDLTINPLQTNRKDIFLSRTANFISGEVVDEQGNIISGAVVIKDWFGPRTLTGVDGRFDTRKSAVYTTRTLSKIKVFTRHEPSNLAAVTYLKDPNNTGNFQGQIILKSGGIIKGRVIDISGKGIPAAYVRLVEGQNYILVAQEATDANGEYCINAVPCSEDELRYSIVAQSQGYSIAAGGPIIFTDDLTKTINMQPIKLLSEDKAISGIVQDVNEEPVCNALVRIEGSEIHNNYRRSYYTRLLTDEHGRFFYKGVSDKPYEIYVRPPSEQQQSGTTFAHGGDTNIKVILGQTLYHAQSLVIKKMPDLAGFGIELNEDGRKVLLCFFDIEQRPSRNCIAELNKRVQGLNEERITLVGIHASRIEKSGLDEWIKDNNIAFRIGMIESDEGQIRAKWGVQSLPWLVLTDTEHVVIAEGFSISELNEQIEEVK